jgi:hypothetical protein
MLIGVLETLLPQRTTRANLSHRIDVEIRINIALFFNAVKQI